MKHSDILWLMEAYQIVDPPRLTPAFTPDGHTTEILEFGRPADPLPPCPWPDAETARRRNARIEAEVQASPLGVARGAARMNLTVYRGTHEIGGTCIEVRSGDTRLILDAGLPLVDANRDPFDSLKALRSTRDELIADGTIPPVPGLFTDDAPAPDAVLLSHAHLDHTGLLHHSRPEIPVYATQRDEQDDAGRRRLRQPTRSGPKSSPADHARGPFQIGDFTVTPFAVDHSTFGCVAFLLEAEGKTLLYSGDLRRHGRKPGMIRTLVEQIAPRNIDVLLIEGTLLGSEREEGVGEFELEEQVVELVRSAPALVLAAFSPQDVDRVVTLYRAAQRTNRVFVADAYAAFVLHLVAGEAHIPRPTRDKGIRVYHNAALPEEGHRDG